MDAAMGVNQLVELAALRWACVGALQWVKKT